MLKQRAIPGLCEAMKKRGTGLGMFFASEGCNGSVGVFAGIQRINAALTDGLTVMLLVTTVRVQCLRNWYNLSDCVSEKIAWSELRTLVLIKERVLARGCVRP